MDGKIAIQGPNFCCDSTYWGSVVTAESNWAYYTIAWFLDSPVNSSAGGRVFAILLSYGSTERVLPRREHAPGQPDLRSSESGAGLMAPIGCNIG
ncbi:MAG: hypothetical protein QXE91_02705 [Thermofilaceae archaeon]